MCGPAVTRAFRFVFSAMKMDMVTTIARREGAKQHSSSCVHHCRVGEGLLLSPRLYCAQMCSSMILSALVDTF